MSLPQQKQRAMDHSQTLQMLQQKDNEKDNSAQANMTATSDMVNSDYEE